MYDSGDRRIATLGDFGSGSASGASGGHRHGHGHGHTHYDDEDDDDDDASDEDKREGQTYFAGGERRYVHAIPFGTVLARRI